MSTRYIAQDISTREFLNWDVPLSKVQVRYSLSGPDEIAGELAPEMPKLNLSAYDSWATALHLEQEGHIRASGILQPASMRENVVQIVATGPSGYPHGIPYLGEFQGIQVDPLDMVRKIWTHVQSYPDSLHGVTLDDTTSAVRIGTEKQAVEFDTTAGEHVQFETNRGPYKLVWWEATDCGTEIDNLARQTPFDYREVASWNVDKTDVDFHIRLGYPRLGRWQDGLRFAQGENVTSAIPLTELEDQYASTVVVLGAGEGRKRVRSEASERGERLRRVVVISDKSIASVDEARKIALGELRRRRAMVSMEQIIVDTEHPNARWGTFVPGDDITVVGEFPWLGWLAIKHRITAIDWQPQSSLASLSLVPSAAQYYGPPLGVIR